MAKVLTFCFNEKIKKNKNKKTQETKTQSILGRICPDNIKPLRPIINYSNGIGFGVMNPHNSIKLSENGICLGYIKSEYNDWDVNFTKIPTGSFSIFRWNDRTVEIISDAVSSRTIWYAKNNELFLASNSQRAIIMFLENFNINRKCFNWMLTSGTLGPHNSWDDRILPLEKGTRLSLSRESWKVALKQYSHSIIKPTNFSPNYYARKLKSVCVDSVNSMDIPLEKWVLTLSGGYDSRAIFLLLKSKNIRLINWGNKSSLNDKDNDSNIPIHIAKYFKKNLTYFENNSIDEDYEKILDRFIKNSEGRIDHIGGYMDGFEMYKNLFENGDHGMIRGDEAFGWQKVNSTFEVKKCLDLLMEDDYSNFPNLNDYGLPKIKLPESYNRRNQESLDIWRDRLYRHFRVSTILSALNETKTSYLEIVNPFLTNEVLQFVNEIPDKLRTDKILFKRIISDISPPIPFSQIDSSSSRQQIINRTKFIKIILDELNSGSLMDLFSKHFLNYIKSKIISSEKLVIPKMHKTKFYDWTKKAVPLSVKVFINRLIYDNQKKRINHNLLLFRIYIIVKAVKMFSRDIRFIKNVTG